MLAVLVLCHCPSVCMDVAGCACSMCNSARHVMVAVLVELIPLWVVGSRSAEGRDFGARRPRQKRISGRGKARLGLRGTAAGGRPVDASLVPARSPLKSPPPGALAGLRGGGRGTPLGRPPSTAAACGVWKHRRSGRECPRRFCQDRVYRLGSSFRVWSSPSPSPPCRRAEEVRGLLASCRGRETGIQGNERARRQRGCPQTQTALAPSSLPLPCLSIHHSASASPRLPRLPPPSAAGF